MKIKEQITQDPNFKSEAARGTAAAGGDGVALDDFVMDGTTDMGPPAKKARTTTQATATTTSTGR